MTATHSPPRIFTQTLDEVSSNADEWFEWTRSNAPAIRLAAADLAQARRSSELLKRRTAGQSEDDTSVVVDLTVLVAPTARAARSILRDQMNSSGEGRPTDSLSYVGTPAGLRGLIFDIRAAGVADGVTLLPLGLHNSISELIRCVREGIDLIDAPTCTVPTELVNVEARRSSSYPPHGVALHDPANGKEVTTCIPEDVSIYTAGELLGAAGLGTMQEGLAYFDVDALRQLRTNELATTTTTADDPAEFDQMVEYASERKGATCDGRSERSHIIRTPTIGLRAEVKARRSTAIAEANRQPCSIRIASTGSVERTAV